MTDIQGINGTFGLLFLSVLPVFVLYSFHAGQKRLIQSDSLQHLTRFGKPIWWYNLHRVPNTSLKMFMKGNVLLRVIEILVLGGIFAAFLAPLFVPSLPPKDTSPIANR